MAKTNKHNSPLDKSKIELEDNVRVLQSGIYGYILNGESTFESADRKNVNAFAIEKNKILKAIISEGKQLAKLEPKHIPNELPSEAKEKIHGKTNNHEAQIKVPSF